MKIKIDYEYDINMTHPYIAWWKRTDTTNVIGTSQLSFEDAKSDLLRKVKLEVNRTKEVPKSEEVEV